MVKRIQNHFGFILFLNEVMSMIIETFREQTFDTAAKTTATRRLGKALELLVMLLLSVQAEGLVHIALTLERHC